MVKNLIVAGWVGVLLLLAGGSSGFFVMGQGDGLTLHIVGAILSTSLLLFFHICMLLYMNGVHRLIERSAVEHDLGEEWLEIYGSIVVRSNVWLLSGLAAVMLVFSSGVPVYTGQSGPTLHVVHRGVLFDRPEAPPRSRRGAARRARRGHRLSTRTAAILRVTGFPGRQ